ncbi:MAG: universal stress protein [Hyphomicrobiaceae bacterium]
MWKPPRTILCATDLTPNCDRAVDRAIELARRWKASLLVVHVVDDTGLPARDFTERVRKSEALLEQQIKGHPEGVGLDIDTLVSLGSPAERILGKCDRLFIDLLVMGPGERTSLGQRLLGSTVDHVLRHALQPVLSVRNRAFAPYRNMAIATDFSLPSKEALDCALALFPDAKATVVHVYDDALHGLLASDKVTGPLAERHKREMRALAEKAIAEFVERPRTLRPDLTTAVEIGAPEAGLKHYIDQSNPDLVVLGTHGRTGLRRAVIGSVAERLIGTLPCDVLAVRPTE